MSAFPRGYQKAFVLFLHPLYLGGARFPAAGRVVIVCHLEASALVAAFHVEAFVRFAAV